MKKLLLSFMLLMGFLSSANAQIVNGDVNHDGGISMTDANALVNIFVNNGKYEYVDGVANELLEGTWYKSNTETVTFGEDGTTGLISGSYTFKYLPTLRIILLYEPEAEYPSRMAFVTEVGSDYVTLANYGTYYSYVPVIKVTDITLSQTELKIDADASYLLTATVTPYNADEKGVVWSSSDASVAMVTNGGLVVGLQKGKATITATAVDGGGASASCKVWVDGYYEYEKGEIGEPVDLGLSVKWASWNVGASKPEEYGNYYAWGEVEPKEDYSWSTYKWMASGYSNWNGVNKYTFADGQTDGCWYSNGTFVGDNKTFLDPEDDAAHVNWGGSWRMPTWNEMDELHKNCTWTWTMQNGVAGYKVTSANGNSIFLPDAGCRHNSSLDGVGGYGRYWSSSLSTHYSAYAYFLRFVSDNIGRSYDYRRYGQSIRPVCQ